VIKHIK